MSKTQTQTPKRSGLKWTVNECLRLEREYDLLKLSIPEIALLHERTSDSIMYKLDQEGIADFNYLYIKNNAEHMDLEKDSDETSNYEEDVEAESESDADSLDSDSLKQQIGTLTKQLANLTAIVFKSLGGGKGDSLPTASYR